MTQMIPSDNDRLHAPLKPPRALRLMLLSMIAVCGVLMIAVVVSQPIVADRFQDNTEQVASQNETQVTYGEAASVLSVGPTTESKPVSPLSSGAQTMAQQPKRKGSDHLPIDRVPVRRGGVVSGK